VKLRLFVTRENFPELLASLRQDNQADVPLAPAELARRLADKDGALVTGFDVLNPDVWARRRR